MKSFNMEVHTIKGVVYKKQFTATNLANARQQVNTYIERHVGIWFPVPLASTVFIPNHQVNHICVSECQNQPEAAGGAV